jgi:hypothetical protein
MLPLRLAIFAVVFGIALSGLFWLLGNLSEPELLRSKKAVVVKGCDPVENEAAARICPQLYCQKYLLDTKAVALRYRFDVTVDQHSGAEHLIGGTAKPFIAGKNKDAQLNFACLLENGQVVTGRTVDAEELDALAAGEQTLAADSQAVTPQD